VDLLCCCDLNIFRPIENTGVQSKDELGPVGVR